MTKQILTLVQDLNAKKINACSKCSGDGYLLGGNEKTRPCPMCADWRKLAQQLTGITKGLYTVQGLRILLERMGEFEVFVNRHLRWGIDIECDDYFGDELPNLVDFVREITHDKGMAKNVLDFLEGRLLEWR